MSSLSLKVGWVWSKRIYQSGQYECILLKWFFLITIVLVINFDFIIINSDFITLKLFYYYIILH